MSTIRHPRPSTLIVLAVVVALVGALAGWLVYHQAVGAAAIGPGWTDPLATMPAISAGFLANNCNGNHTYIKGYYHLGDDYPTGIKTPVRAIGAGTVLFVGSFGDGNGNVALIQHKASDGSQFIAVYGHINYSVARGATVSAGQQIGTVAAIAEGSHLHLGILPGTTYPSQHWGQLLCNPNWTSNAGRPFLNGFVDPVSYLSTHPSNGGSSYGPPSDYASKIVQWDNGPHAQKTAWLVSPDLKRYWIPDSSTFNCLRSSGFALVGTLSAALLDQLPDQTGHWARCNGDTLATNQYLFRGASLSSSNGQYHLELRKSDGVLVLLGPTGTTLVINGQPSDYLVMQPDGNLVTFAYKGGATWSSNTGGKGANHLVVTNYGNLGLYTSGDLLVWTTLFDSQPVAGVATFTPTPQPRPTATFTPTPTPVTSHAVNAYDNYGTANWVDHAMCRGNPARPESMPGGMATQTFIVPGGVASLNSVKVQTDPDTQITVYLHLLRNGTEVVNMSTAAIGDTQFNFGPVAVSPGDQMTLEISFSATYGKLTGIYTVGNPGGQFTASNSCSDGAPNVSTTSTGLRAVVSGMS